MTLTTVGYGDIVPITTAGRFAGVAVMFTGIGVLGVLAGSLAELFHLDEPSSPKDSPAEAVDAPPLHAELTALRDELQALELRVGDLADRARADAG